MFFPLFELMKYEIIKKIYKTIKNVEKKTVLYL